jgi:hypothetical protein
VRKGKKVVRVVIFNSGFILGWWPYWISSAETDDGELAGCDLDTALFINEVENGTMDLNDLLGCFRQDEGRIWSVDGFLDLYLSPRI